MQKYKIGSIKKELNHKVIIPGSKSYTNRALIIAALATGKSVLNYPLYSDDTKYMMESLRKLGVELKEEKNRIVINGCCGKFDVKDANLFCGIAGTTSRFLTGVAALLNQEVIVDGEGKILERPIGELVNGLRELGVKIEYIGKEGSLPLKINSNGLSGNNVSMKGDVSSQYFTSLLMIAPMLKNGLTINVIGEQVSKSYIDITVDIMKQFGVEVINDNYKRYIVKAGQSYKGREYNIEGDWSSASYLCCIGALHKGSLEIQNLNNKSVQGDRNFAKLIEQSGAKVIYNENGIIIYGNEKIKPLNIDMQQMPDTSMSIAMLLSFANGESKITGLSTLKDKETKRLLAIKTELSKLDIESEIGDDYIIIHGGNPHAKDIVEIETYDDHRIAMSFAIVGSKIDNVSIKNPNVVKKSFVNFWETLKRIGVGISEI